MKNILHLSITIFFAFFIFFNITSAQTKQVLSVTPPLFQVSAQKGDIWKSSVKVVNGNDYPLTVYLKPVNFDAIGEYGVGKFIEPNSSDESKSTLAEWIVIADGPQVILPEQSIEVPFFIEIPNDAPPGGHYSALIVSTEPPKSDEALLIKTSQAVTSLFFLRIEGDVDERGNIREFSPTKTFLGLPDVEFLLRFENKGNVHLQPKGIISITNMWGTERGTIPINYQTHFGNVLPDSIREFRYTWKSNFRLSDIGRYRAEISLNYGERGIKSVSSTAYFYIFPLKGTLVTFFILTTFISMIVFMVRLYVRRMLTLAGVEVNQDNYNGTKFDIKNTYRRASLPLRDGVLDLRTSLHKEETIAEKTEAILTFINKYRWFFVSLLIVLIMVGILTRYGKSVKDENRAYEAGIEEGTTVHRIQN